MHAPKTATLCAAVLLTLGWAAHGADMGKDEYEKSKADLSTQLKANLDECASLKANARDVCIEKAKAHEKVALAELEVRYAPSAKHDYELQMAKANADYAVAKEKCDDQAGDAKVTCRKEALRTFIAAKAQAKQDEKISETRQKASRDVQEARYKAAIERCDALAGEAKAGCIADAKTRYGKN